jgi:hypothetical protein
MQTNVLPLITVLQEWIHQKLPNYLTKLEGELHQPKFRSNIEVCGKRFPSYHSYSHLKDAGMLQGGI